MKKTAPISFRIRICCLLLSCFVVIWSQPPKRPNIIYIMADDLGYADIGVFGQNDIKTPRIDKMAHEGILFTDHYSAATVCAPARASLMTGLHQGHAPIRGNQKVGDDGDKPIPAEYVTVAELLKEANYVTGGIGKWGTGGDDSEGDPMLQGFDHWFGYLGQVQAHNYYQDHLWLDGEYFALDGNTYTHDLLANDALDFISKNADTTFFLYVPFTIPHASMAVPELEPYTETKDWPAVEKKAASMISRMDRDVGRMLDTLIALGIHENTLVIFTSDNGPHSEGGHKHEFFDSNGELQGFKRDLHDGGIRVPFVAWWPGTIKDEIVSNHVSYFPDFLPTACEIAGIPAPEGIDGISYLPALLDKPQEQADFQYWEFNNNYAVRIGNWKGVSSSEGWELYDLSVDIAEANDISVQNPDIVSQIDSISKASLIREENVIVPVMPEITRGCLDPNYDEYDSIFHVHDQRFCEGINNINFAKSKGLIISMGNPLTIEININGQYKMIVKNLQGITQLTKNGSGPRNYKLEEVIEPGVYILQITSEAMVYLQRFTRL